MAGPLTRSVAHVLGHTGALKKVPVARLLVAAEVAVLARDHLRERLTPDERHRIIELVRIAHGRPRNLRPAERDELAALVAKAQPRRLAGEAVETLSPFPLPHRLIYGRRRTR